NSLPRWLISMTDMPLPRQSSISAAACRSTSSGSTAGPALKFHTRIGDSCSRIAGTLAVPWRTGSKRPYFTRTRVPSAQVDTPARSRYLRRTRSGRRRFIARAVALGAAPLAVHLSAQGGYPNKPIKIIAPVQPGGGVDLVARTIADRLSRVL